MIFQVAQVAVFPALFKLKPKKKPLAEKIFPISITEFHLRIKIQKFTSLFDLKATNTYQVSALHQAQLR